jgi:molybdopterin/thiamine biosynthesis adenylyltransferase
LERGTGSRGVIIWQPPGLGISAVDADVVDASNLQRQILHDTAHVGELKAESGKEKLLALNPFIEVDAITDFFNAGSAMEISKDYDIVLDCTDNFATRYLINDLCVLTGRKCMARSTALKARSVCLTRRSALATAVSSRMFPRRSFLPVVPMPVYLVFYRAWWAL